MNTGSRKIQKPFIIPIFLPHAGCPHRCVFCNQTAITSANRSLLQADQFRAQVNAFLSFNNNRRKAVQIAFYGGNFLGLPIKTTQALLSEAAAFVKSGKVDSIRFSTRPDTIVPERLNLLKDFPVKTIEVGVQSLDDEVLALSNRGHSAQETVEAVGLLKQTAYEIGLQLMVGLPGDNEDRALQSAEKSAALSPDFIRIYPTVVLNNSPLARLYRQKQYVPLSLGTAVSLCKKLYLVFESHAIAVIRMGLQASQDLDDGAAILAGPYHPAFGQLVLSEIFLDKARALLAAHSDNTAAISLRVHPRSLSRLQGLHKQNIQILKNEFKLTSIPILTDKSLAANELRVV